MKNETYFVEKDGKKRRNTIIIDCERCGKAVVSRADQVRRFCSRTCSDLASRVRDVLTCAYCDKEFERRTCAKANSKHGVFFCCRQHKDWGQRVENGIARIHPPHYADGSSEYRSRALREHGEKCAGCNYSELQSMLDVHHIDADRSNGALDNLIVLCVFCHALVTRGHAGVGEDRKLFRTGE